MSLYQRFTGWLFFVPDRDRSRWEIIVWWELRRIPYNLVVGIVGICSVFLFYFFTGNEPIVDGQDIGEPFMFLLAPFGVNICYTAGWIVEAFFPQAFLESFMVERRQVGAKFLRDGIRLSLIVVLLPTGVWGFLWLLRVVGLRH